MFYRTLNRKALPNTFRIAVARSFSQSAPHLAKNRILDPVRTPSEFETLLMIHTSRSVPLITMFTASWCRSCAEVYPIVKGLIQDEYVGLPQGGVGFIEVQLDSPLIEDLGTRYAVRSIPTLMSFSRGEPQMETRVTDVEKLRNHEFLIQWIEKEAARGGKGGAGGSFFKGLFGS